ncbi:MAG: hypothetical protein R3Y40_07430 [Eubacteriales bacterium]
MSKTEDKIKKDKVQQYKCPNCDGAVEFDSTIQQLKCPYCDSEFDVESLKELGDISNTEEREPVWDTYDENSGNGDWSEEEKAKVCHYICQSCAGEIITDATTVARHCPYCGNPVIIASELEGALRPDLVIPFKLDKEAAKESLYGFLKGKKLLPKCFKDENHIEEISGIYVPYWLYNCAADGKAVFSAKKVKHWSDARFNYTKTDHYALHREGSLEFAKVPADGSQKMDDTLMDSLEPYDYSAAVDFNTAYLSGYFADKYDVTSEDNLGRVNTRISQSMIDQLRSTIHNYDSCQVSHKDISIKNGKIEYALLPMWLLKTKYNGEDYTFAMNGQTGKFVGELPIDRGLVIKYFMGVFASCATIGTILAMVLM